MSVDVSTVLRVLDVCQALQVEEKPFISLVFSHKSGMSCQVFLDHVPGKMLRDYVLDPVLQGYLSLHMAYRTRVLDHHGIHRRLTYIPKPNDELRFVRVRAGVV